MDSVSRQELIKKASQAYYSNGTSPLTDAEFDALLEEERAENPNSPLLGVGHGYDVNLTSGQKFQHRYGIVGSLPKCHDWNEFPKSLRNIAVCTSLKLDGISCVMYYRNGIMYQALTRGSDNIGIDITNKVKKIAPSYFQIADKEFTGAVRGEILMSFAKFDEFSATRENAENARNSTAGLMGMNEVSDDLKYLDIITYRVIGIESMQSYPFPLYPFSDYQSMHSWLITNYGEDNVVPIGGITYTDDTQFMNDMKVCRDSWYNQYPADGIVITSNNIKFVSQNVGAYIDYDSTAFKFPAETKETVIRGIEWNLSKTKYLVPTVLVEPVRLSGATVSRAAGCNAKMVIDKKWGVGAKIKITRSGEVIPKIEETVIPATSELPTVCPCCDAELIWDGVHLKCPNPDCKDSQIQDLLVWCSNIAPTDGLGDTLKLKFFEEWANTTGSELSIEGFYSIGIGLPGEGAQYNLFLNMLEGLRHNKVSAVSALKALNIPRLGDATADLLSHYPEDIDKLIDGEIPDNLAYKLGNANAESIARHSDKFKRLKYIKENIVFDSESSNNDRIKVAITGSLSISRKEFEKLLNEHGFVLDDMKKDTQYLITDNPNSGSSKNAKADKLGIPKLTEAEFRAKFNI
jgi:DNA ligase (NAD+)